MAMEFHKLGFGGPAVDTVKVDQYWYLTEDKTRVVPENHPDSRFLWASPGDEVPRAHAEKLGALTAPDEPGDPGEDEDPDTGEKAKQPAPNKQRRQPRTKAATAGEE